MRRITISVDDEILAAVRRYAAELGATGKALVREFLTNVAGYGNLHDIARRDHRQPEIRGDGAAVDPVMLDQIQDRVEVFKNDAGRKMSALTLVSFRSRSSCA
jgi:hypothetical protein